MTSDPIIISFPDLQSGAADQRFPDAFGPHSLGIIVVRDLPAEYSKLRERVLKSASILSSLGPERLAELEVPEGYWLVGWSRGREKLKNNQLDIFKGSYYVNCAFHKDPSFEGPPKEEIIGFEEHIGYTTENKWPLSVLEDISGDKGSNEIKSAFEDFESDMKKLCNLMIDVATIVAKACDRYVVDKIDGYTPNYLEKIVSNSTTTKARLLHYFPLSETFDYTDDHPNDDDGGDWCGEHLDHSCLTALTSNMFLDNSDVTNPFDYSSYSELEENPDPDSGLYIKDRHGIIKQVNIPRDCLAFQTGSALQEITHDQFKAVPHLVKGISPKKPRLKSVCRNTLAVFCQPSLHDMVNNSENFAAYSKRVIRGNH